MLATQRTFVNPAVTDLMTLCRMEGPCVSIFLAPHLAGSGTRASGTSLLAMLPKIEVALREWGAAPAAMLAPVEAMAKESQLSASHGQSLCLFRSTEGLHCFSVRAVLENGWHVEDHCLVMPLFEHLDYRQSFLLLTLAGKHVRLLRYEGGNVAVVPIPDGVPESAAEFIGDERDEESSRNHAPGVRFGSSEGREKNGRFRREFMKAIDRGIQPLLRMHGLPLVLAGVPEETAAYAAVSEYGELLPEAVRMSPDGGATEGELAGSAASLIKRWSNAAERQALAEYRDAGLGRRRTGFAAIMKAARAGQVHHLFVERGERGGTVNEAAVEVLLHKGMVWLVEPEQMPEAGVMAAVMRYADDKAGE